ncbi:DUF3168 domain-containing protein [Devosia sp. MC521]|uniref:DUF3168 domain-containing protein n=1 Tax=Devosia sp. MC521 TaxID=2759954 RepID=UPI0015FA01F2|nr:DUF3168 domain-containing protein [Devosia sp. MC521]MBJ6986942.1 DUF3168 domain-containing protein [Devosia sp. MC521]QMW63966.1 DUF3168 domain-containing protein [Devosia sp. MC521]
MEPSYDLQLAALNKLREVAALTAIVGNKIYDRVPEKLSGGALVPDVASPYISFGPVTSAPVDADCIDGEEITFQIDVWSWGSGLAYGSVQARQIAGLVKKALHKADLDLSTNALVSIRHEMTRILRESDGVTNHAAIQFTATVETL